MDRFIRWCFYDTADDLTAATEEGGYSLASDWFFQMVFCATAISIVSGACAERIKLWPFMIFAAFMTELFTQFMVLGPGEVDGSQKWAF